MSEANGNAASVSLATLEQDYTVLSEEMQQLLQERQTVIDRRQQIDTAIARQQGALQYLERAFQRARQAAVPQQDTPPAG